MIEVDYGGGGAPHRAKRSRDQLFGLWGAPSLVYKGVEEGERAGHYGAPWRSLTPTGSRIPPSLVGLGEKEGGEREEGKGAPFLVQFRPEEEGGSALYGVPWRSPTPSGSRVPPSLVGLGEKEGGEREEGKGGRRPPPSPIRTRGGGARGLPWPPLSLH